MANNMWLADWQPMTAWFNSRPTPLLITSSFKTPRWQWLRCSPSDFRMGLHKPVGAVIVRKTNFMLSISTTQSHSMSLQPIAIRRGSFHEKSADLSELAGIYLYSKFSIFIKAMQNNTFMFMYNSFIRTLCSSLNNWHCIQNLQFVHISLFFFFWEMI